MKKRTQRSGNTQRTSQQSHDSSSSSLGLGLGSQQGSVTGLQTVQSRRKSCRGDQVVQDTPASNSSLETDQGSVIDLQCLRYRRKSCGSVAGLQILQNRSKSEGSRNEASDGELKMNSKYIDTNVELAQNNARLLKENLNLKHLYKQLNTRCSQLQMLSNINAKSKQSEEVSLIERGVQTSDLETVAVDESSPSGFGDEPKISSGRYENIFEALQNLEIDETYKGPSKDESNQMSSKDLNEDSLKREHSQISDLDTSASVNSEEIVTKMIDIRMGFEKSPGNHPENAHIEVEQTIFLSKSESKALDTAFTTMNNDPLSSGNTHFSGKLSDSKALMVTNPTNNNINKELNHDKYCAQRENLIINRVNVEINSLSFETTQLMTDYSGAISFHNSNEVRHSENSIIFLNESLPIKKCSSRSNRFENIFQNAETLGENTIHESERSHTNFSRLVSSEKGEKTFDQVLSSSGKEISEAGVPSLDVDEEVYDDNFWQGSDEVVLNSDNLTIFTEGVLLSQKTDGESCEDSFEPCKESFLNRKAPELFEDEEFWDDGLTIIASDEVQSVRRTGRVKSQQKFKEPSLRGKLRRGDPNTFGEIPDGEMFRSKHKHKKKFAISQY